MAMKTSAVEAAAAFIDDLDELPDQLLQKPAFRIKRQVKALHQVVSDLELPVTSILSIDLECINTSVSTASQSPQQPVSVGVPSDEQHTTLLAYIQAGVDLALSHTILTRLLV